MEPWNGCLLCLIITFGPFHLLPEGSIYVPVCRSTGNITVFIYFTRDVGLPPGPMIIHWALGGWERPCEVGICLIHPTYGPCTTPALGTSFPRSKSSSESADSDGGSEPSAFLLDFASPCEKGTGVRNRSLWWVKRGFHMVGRFHLRSKDVEGAGGMPSYGESGGPWECH